MSLPWHCYSGILHWEKMCYCHAWDNKRCFIYIYIKEYTKTRTSTGIKIFFPSKCKTKASVRDQFILSLIGCFHRLLSLLSSYCILYLSSCTQQLHSPPLFCLISPCFLYPFPCLSSSFFLLFSYLLLLFSFFLFPSRAPMADPPPLPLMPNLFLSFIPHPCAFPPLDILVFGGCSVYLASVENLCVHVSVCVG